MAHDESSDDTECDLCGVWTGDDYHSPRSDDPDTRTCEACCWECNPATGDEDEWGPTITWADIMRGLEIAERHDREAAWQVARARMSEDEWRAARARAGEGEGG